MLASQMIYTACGKEKTGAFSVWAKSDDVTKAECDQIIKLMSYERPRKFPFNPTEEQILAYPKKYGYFILSSGRKCIAQMTYLGKVYSDLDFRNGNFIIHAFIFKSLDGYNPFNLFKLDLFKSNLTYKEWHDNPCPDTLPSVEIANLITTNTQAVFALLSGKNKNAYVSLLQAIINATETDTDATVTFNDTEENEKLIYSLIGLLIPARFFEKTTFVNQYLTRFEFALSSNGLQPIKIRNMFADELNLNYKYQEEINIGHYAFNFLEGIYSKVDPQEYITDIVEFVSAGNNLFSILKRVEEINGIMCKTNCSLDIAVGVYYLKQCNLSFFTGVEDYRAAVDVAVNYNYTNPQTIAQILYDDVILTGKWGKGSRILPLIKFVYQNSDKGVRNKILYDFLGNLSTFGINTTDRPYLVSSRIKEIASFIWADFAAETVNNAQWENYIRQSSTPSELCFVFDGIVAEIKERRSDAEVQRGFILLVRILKKIFENGSYEDFQSFMRIAGCFNSQATNYLIENTLNGIYNTQISNETRLNYVLRIICSFDDVKEKTHLLAELILANCSAQFFIPVYLKFEAENKQLFMQAENLISDNRIYREFKFRKDAYAFGTSSRVSLRELAYYCEKYYRKGYDNGIYFVKIKQYLSMQTEACKAREALQIYLQIQDLDANYADVLTIVKYLSEVIFYLTVDDLLKIRSQYSEELETMCTTLSNAHIPFPDTYQIMKTVLVMNGKIPSSECLRLLKTNSFYSNLNALQLSKYIDDFYDKSLNCYIELKKKKLVPINVLIKALFEEPIRAINKRKSIIIAINMSKCSYEIVADLMSFALSSDDFFAGILLEFMKDYINSLKHGEYKKTIKKVEELLDKNDKKEMDKFIAKYSDEQKSFFGKLFSKKK